MEEKFASLISWEEGEPAQTLLAPEQSMAAVVSSDQGKVIFLTDDGRVYLSTLKQETSGLSGKLQELALPCQCVIGVACNSTHAIFVTDRGRVLRSSLQLPEKVEEMLVSKPKFCCPHGLSEDGERLIIREIASNFKSIFLISDSGQIWVIDESKSPYPELLTTFRDKTVLSLVCGNDFTVALIQEHIGDNKTVFSEDTNSGKRLGATRTRKTSSKSVDESSVFTVSPDISDKKVVSFCPECRHEQEVQQSIQNLNLESKNDQSVDQTHSNTIPKEDGNTLAQVCWSKADNLVRQSALFLNSDAAKQFLTRQLSWVTGSSEMDSELSTDHNIADSSNPDSKMDAREDLTDSVSRVVENCVRNLGDTVNRMSRHWSGTSQEEVLSIQSTTPAAAVDNSNDSDSFETISLQNWVRSSAPPTADSSPVAPRLYRQVFEKASLWKRNASSSLSLDSMVPLHASPRNGNHQQVKAETHRITQAGQCLLNTSVWTWGHGGVGQLGQSDCVSRNQPTPIKSLNGIGVLKLSVGSLHSLALTIDGRVYSWGNNSKGQADPGSSPNFITTPVEVTLPFRATVKDIAAGGEHSLLLTTNGEVFFMGYSLATQKSTLMRLNLPVQSPHGLAINQRIWASGSLSCCCCSFQSCVCSSQWVELVLSEQLFFRTCANVATSVFPHLLPLGSDSQITSVRQELFAQYRRLISALAYNIHSLADIQCADRSTELHPLAIVRWIGEYVEIYRSYTRALCNALVINAFALNKQESTSLDKVWPGIVEIFAEAKGTKTFNPFHMIMQEPIGRLKEYSFHLKKLVSAHPTVTAPGKERSDTCLLEAARRYEETGKAMEAECQSADATRAFWESCSTKLTDAMRTPDRRLIRESRSHPLNVINSGRFSTHWFILLSDIFVHVGYSGHVAYPLSTIWVESLQDCDETQTKNCLAVTMPEDSLTLTCPTPVGKVEWLMALQLAIKRSLNMATDEPTAARTSPPLARYATYTFTKLPLLKDVTYKGWWLCGKMHGEGQLTWPDGKLYKGQFRQNLQYGYGIQESFGSNGSSYEGSWKDGKMNGYGILKYANGDIYEGYFSDNLPHGHGTLKRGHFLTSAAHVYVGQWEAGQKHGYGVMDDIVAGEKYMGMWMGDAKHGSAVLVTLDGLYIEGCFNNNKMTGQCIMLLEDGTSYEGEVAGVGVLGGKGVLRLPNGDVIQGTFHGSWSEGIKMNATLTKATISSSSSHAAEKPLLSSQINFNPSIPGQFCVSGQRKWEAIFRLCSQALDVPLVSSLWTAEHGHKAWDQIAVAVSQPKKRCNGGPQYKSSAKTLGFVRKASKASKPLLIMDGSAGQIPEILQRIPDFGRTPGHLTLEEYRKIELYLQKALESIVHPLGRMVGHLVDVYRATYVGVGAHPRLLPHAVAEVHSFVSRIYAFIRLLFPALPSEDRPCYLDEEGIASEDNKEALLVSASTLLLPLLLPRVYPPLFTLYALYNEKEDNLYWDRLQKWNRQSDLALMNFLGVDPKFYDEEKNGSHFSGAVDCLQQLSTTFSPGEKLNVIQSTFQEINKAVQTHHGSGFIWNMDDLFPVFQFVVVRSRIRHLGSEIHLIDDLIERSLPKGEIDIMFTTLKASYFHIRQEKMNFT